MTTNNKSLSLLVAEMSQVLTQIVEAGGELSPEIESMFDSLGTEIQTKTDNYAFFMERLDSEAEYWKARAETMTKVARSCINLKARLNDSIKLAMQQLGQDEIKGNEMRFKLSKLAPKLVLEEAAVTDAYKMIVTQHVPDKERIKHDLAAGLAVPGARMEDVFSLRKYVNRGEK